MIQGYAYTPRIWPSVFTVLLWVALSIYSWRRRRVPGALPFAIGVLFAAAWGAASVMESAAVQVDTKITWFKVQGAFQLPAITATTCFVLEYAQPGRWLTRRNLALLSIAPLLFVVMVLTNDVHHLAWRGFSHQGQLIAQRGAGNWIITAYGYGLGVLNIVVLVSLSIRSPEHRWPVVLMLTGQVAGRVLYALQAANIAQSPVRLDLVALAVPSTTYAVAMFGFHIFDPIPLARRAVIAQMGDGVLVLDDQGRVASLNPAAERIVGAPAKSTIGRRVDDVLPGHSDVCGPLDSSGAEEAEITLGTGPETRHYSLVTSSLKNRRGLAVGRLLLLRDVTERRRAQEQALQQQWTEATLEERKLLAQELHDGLAQSLGFLNLQAQAARAYLERGQGEAAQDSLDRLAQVAVEVHEDTRELIGNLLAISFPSEGFFGALRQAVDRFREQNDLPVNLAIADDVDTVCNSQTLPPVACMQLLRIVQEALANVRKHAGSPSQVSVELRAKSGQLQQPGLLQLTITDNGAGFDPALVGTDGKHFGLRVMRQRAARIGGQLSVRSAPGEGTQVEASAPLGGAASVSRASDEAVPPAAAGGWAEGRLGIRPEQGEGGGG